MFKHSVYFTSYCESADVVCAYMRKHSTDNDASALIKHSAYSA